uniref:ATP synthase subunit a n=9 Tax=Myzomyia TaxID=59140 RepID=A0A7T1NMC1_9DIPT|nr:ATP synthase F0 subunit 6 [Anopheles culicifacies]YP_009176745.1 ATP synthase F0 subunit 6 [Anopheles minimus]YP_009519874.1 ATP synthase F0 subunit 6 [Anopheles aconitus]YP_010126880.1 ATP synthase F0 subunit 6 [Anopheles vaneedeni]YP_010126893.1 ATP synthase F0 subunit 6 [Anopheles parensis]YP_010126906.1 ATP synthase F0 subunit 6 [Anopheles longipalpis]YP_010126919.1 ATP synthase F0 subunit 6 [Anopheles funestus-like sensu Spillings et al. (2009)]YP_010126932.1 ATP synthase F0 subunit 
MMTNLFSVFDPSTSILNLSLNWLSTFLGLFLIPMSYWLMPNRFQLIWNNILLTLHKEFKTLLGPSGHNGSTLMFISLFSLIMFNNFLGLFPYIFTSTSHLTLTLTLAFPLWLSFMLYGWINHTQHMFAHLVPQGTPPVLMPFMVCIETISNVIRPGTLAVRLTANMIAGHLLLTLLGNTGPVTTNYIILSVILTTQIALLVLESAVAIIQSYVFAVLSTLYSSEVN